MNTVRHNSDSISKTQRNCWSTNPTMANMSWEPTNTSTGEVFSDVVSPSSKAFVDSFVNELSFCGPLMSEDQLQRDSKKQSETIRRRFSASTSSVTAAASSSPGSKGRRSSRRIRSSPDIASSNPNKSSSPARAGAEDAVPHEPVNWKTAVDPVSGRTYFYDTVTRKTQWEKPLELRAWEKFLKKEQRQKDQVFFRSMEDNIRNSLLRQQLIPGVPTSSTARTGPPQEPLATQPSQIRVRTISAMNEFLLSEVNGNSSSEEDKNHNHSSNNNNNDKNLSNHPGVNHNHVITPNSTATPSSSVATATLSAGSIGLTRAVSLVKGRPPLPTQRSRSHDINADVQNLAALILSPDEVPKKLKNNATQQSDSSLPEDSLAGEWLLGDLSPEKPLGELRTIHNTENMEDIANSFDKKNKSDSEKRTSPTTTPPATLASNSSSSHLRRNTESTIYVQSTMDNPDVNAMIKCVSGVYRAHIVQSLDRKTKKSPVSVSTVHVNLDLFRDDYESAGHHHLNNPMTKAPATVPDLKVIEAFYQEFYRRSQMEHDTIIMSLIYVERLIKETNGALAPTLENWRSVLFSCMILASKVWDDLSMWNIDFSNVSTATGLSSFSLQRINQLELALLTSLSFSVKVPASEYAKYYFLIRTMLIRSGLLADAALPLNKAEAKMLETRTSEYEATKLKGPREGRRARSIDWSWLAGSEPEQQQQHYHHHPPAGPVLKDKICLEHLVAK